MNAMHCLFFTDWYL